MNTHARTPLIVSLLLAACLSVGCGGEWSEELEADFVLDEEGQLVPISPEEAQSQWLTDPCPPCGSRNETPDAGTGN